MRSEQNGIVPKNFYGASDILLGGAIGLLTSIALEMLALYAVPAFANAAPVFKIGLLIICCLSGAVSFILFGLPYRKKVETSASSAVENVLLRSGFEVVHAGEHRKVLMPDPAIHPSKFGHEIYRVFFEYHETHVEITMSLYFGFMNWRKLGVEVLKKEH